MCEADCRGEASPSGDSAGAKMPAGEVLET